MSSGPQSSVGVEIHRGSSLSCRCVDLAFAGDAFTVGCRSEARLADDKRRPAFGAVQKIATFKSPEELFGKLTGRAPSHAYLRGPQQDVLREYEEYVDAPNVAAELPTGTGKTTVGLLIAEWHRRTGKRVAYLSLTNQLARQVLEEGRRLGVPCADLRGKKNERSAAAEGRFKARRGVGVSSYSNLFNVNPLIRECELLVLDDAHGAEQHVCEMWTVVVRKSGDEALFNSLLTDLRHGMSESQLSALLDPSGFRTVDMVDVLSHPECLTAATATLDKVDTPSIRFPWSQIRNRLPACLFLVSSSEITVRPLIPPTHTHTPFAAATQRIFMSATLGGDSDLRRAYCIDKVKVVRAKSQQWGRRYIFVPGMYINADEADALVGKVWEGMAPRRAVLLAPSRHALNRAFAAVTGQTSVPAVRFDAADIQDSVDGFVGHDNAILALAARYDGLDLPGDQCRLLVMAESPAATNALERNLSERWKLGPVLRKRERTRLVQGMGRCTRDATDFAVIIWLGQSLVNAAVSEVLLAGMPAELAAEIRWGLKQVEAVKSAGEVADMIGGLLVDADYRKSADALIGEAIDAGPVEEQLEEYEKVGADEVYFSRAMWDEDYGRALELARSIVDGITAEELAGYRAWWWYLASMAAALAKNTSGARDALQRGAACGVNAGYLRWVAIHRAAGNVTVAVGDLEPNGEAIWDIIECWGWAGPKFAANIENLRSRLDDPRHAAYHEGLETLGKCVGAATIRTTEPGAPDVVWSFPADTHFSFEAKTEKKKGGQLSKKDLQEARGHVDWVRARVADDGKTATVDPIVVSPDSTVHEIGEPFKGGLYYLAPPEICVFAQKVSEQIWQLRLKYAGRDYSSAQKELSVDIRAMRLDVKSTVAFLKAASLANVAASG